MDWGWGMKWARVGIFLEDENKIEFYVFEERALKAGCAGRVVEACGLGLRKGVAVVMKSCGRSVGKGASGAEDSSGRSSGGPNDRGW